MSYILIDLRVPIKLPVTLFCDNRLALLLADHPCYHSHTKHIAIDYHFTHDQVTKGFLCPVFQAARDQIIP